MNDKRWTDKFGIAPSASVILHEAKQAAAQALIATLERRDITTLEDIYQYAAESENPGFFDNYVAARLMSAMSGGKLQPGINDDMAEYLRCAAEVKLEDLDIGIKHPQAKKITDSLTARAQTAIDTAIDAVATKHGLSGGKAGPS